METFPILHTPRLLLRQLRADDIPSLVKYANNERIAKYVLNIPHPYQEHEAVFRISYVLQGFKNKARYVFAIISKEHDELVGEIGLHMVSDGIGQLGYWVGEPFWNKGIATDALKAVISFGFEKLALNRIFATIHFDNPASGRVVIHSGFHADNTNGNITQYSITKQQYESIKANSETL